MNNKIALEAAYLTMQQDEKYIEILEAALLEADKGLEFYGDGDNWHYGHDARETRQKIEKLVNEIKGH